MYKRFGGHCVASVNKQFHKISEQEKCSVSLVQRIDLGHDEANHTLGTASTLQK